MAFLRLKAALALLATFNGLLANAQTSTLQELTNFGPNPTNVQMYVYKPLSLPESPALLVANHWCSGSAQDYYQYTRYAQLADTNGYIVLYGNAPDPSKCWDVWSNATLTHDAGGDSLAIASAVRYAIANYNVDPARVYSTGTSSGAMFTNVLLGAYPDLFSAGSLISGVPYGCFAGPTSWNSQCSNGQLIQTGQQWGDLVRSGYPGFTGVRPKVQFWHSSGDDVLYPQNYYEEIKQWTNIFGVSETPTSVVENDPLPDYTRSSWGPNVQGIWAEGRDHSNLYPIEEVVLEWFGLNQPVPSNPPTSSSTVPSSSASETPSSTPSSTPTSVPGTVPQWGQCGGISYVGATSCVSPFTCTELNPWYFQCL